MLKVAQNLESLSIETPDTDLFFELQAMIKRNFAKTLGQKAKVISFYDESEKVQRKYFVKFLKKLCARYEVEANLNFAEYKTIKLYYKQPNSLKTMVFVDVAFLHSSVIFSFDKANDFFINHVIKGYEAQQIFTKDGQMKLAVNVKTPEECERLEEIFNTGEYMKFSIVFNLSEEEFDKFKLGFKSPNLQKNSAKFIALAALFEEHFSVLGCKMSDEFDDVRARYLQLVKLYHPDRHVNKTPTQRQECRDKFERITKAYEALRAYFRERVEFGG